MEVIRRRKRGCHPTRCFLSALFCLFPLMLFYRVSQAVVSFILINYFSVECFSIFISDFVALGVLFLSVCMGCAKLSLIVCLLMSCWFMTSVSSQDSIICVLLLRKFLWDHTAERRRIAIATSLRVSWHHAWPRAAFCAFLFSYFLVGCSRWSYAGRHFCSRHRLVDVWFFADWPTEILMASTVELVIWWCCAM